jgi:hypothetical protein
VVSSLIKRKEAIMPIEPFRPTAFQSALLLLRLRESRDDEKKRKTRTKSKTKEEKGMTRFRVSELTLKRICGRPRLHAEFLTEMQDWLLRAGWAFFFADRSFGMIKLEAVESWTRLGSKRIADELDAVANGGFDFAPLVHLAEHKSSVQDD